MAHSRQFGHNGKQTASYILLELEMRQVETYTNFEIQKQFELTKLKYVIELIGCIVYGRRGERELL